MEVRHINRSSSATRQPELDTGAKFEYETQTDVLVVRMYYSNRIATL